MDTADQTHSEDPPPSGEDAHAADAHHVGGGHDHPHALVGHAHEDSGDHDVEALGPIDWGAWTASLAGVGSGVLIALVLAVAASH
jgi:hypothetical protein